MSIPLVESIIVEKPRLMKIVVDCRGGKCIDINQSDIDAWCARIPKKTVKR